MLVRYPALLMSVPPWMLYPEMLAMRHYGCVILIVYLFYGNNVSFLWQITVPWMQVAQQPVSIYGDLSICLNAPRNRGFSVNMSLTECAVIDGVISPGIVGETLPTGVQLILPARFQVITVLKWVNPLLPMFG
jgi:hypothetical protein